MGPPCGRTDCLIMPNQEIPRKMGYKLSGIRIIGRSVREVGAVGEAGDDDVEVLGGLLTTACARLGVLGLGAEPRLRRRVAVAEVFGQRGVSVGVVPLELGQEPLDRHGQELGAAETGHMAEDMGRVEPLAGDVEIECPDEPVGDVLEDAGGEVVVAEELLIAFDGACGDRGAGFAVECVLDVGAEDVGFGGLLGGPSEEVGEEDEPGHGIEFLGGRAQGVAEVLSEFADGHHFEQDVAEDALPAVADDLPPGRRYDPVKGVEEAVLSRVDGVDHGGRNSFSKIRLSIEWRPGESRGKLAIKSDYSTSCDEN